MRKKSMKQRVFAVALATAFAFSPAFPSFTAFAASETMEDASEAKGAITDEKLSIKDSYAQGQVTTSWTFNYSNDALKPAAIKKIEVPGYYYWTEEGGKYIYKPSDYKYEEEYNYSYTYPVYEVWKQWDSETGMYNYSLAEGSKTTYDVWDPYMNVMIFDSGDRTKPDGGTMSKDSAGKYVITDNYTGFSYRDPKTEPNAKYLFTVDANYLNPGKKDVVGYTVDRPKYNEALAKAYAADSKEYYEACIAYYKAKQEWDKNKNGNEPEAPEWSDYTANEDKVSEADYYITTNVVNIEVSMAASIGTVVKTTSVELSLMAAGATGYEIYRKAGKKYIKIATVASAKYVDKGLTANTTYEYKVRPYYVNRYTGKTSYGKYTTTEVTTTGSALNLKATVTSKNKVKLSWKKVTGATKYQIYRVDTYSMETEKSNTGGYNTDYNSFSAAKLIATVKKNKKSYTDKSVLTDRSYSYMVRAVLPKNSKKSRFIDDWAGVSIQFGALENVTVAEDAQGNKTVKWDQVYGAAGYLVEKYEEHYKEVPAYYDYDYEMKYNSSTNKIYYINSNDETVECYQITGDKVYYIDYYGNVSTEASYKKIGNVLYDYDEYFDEIEDAKFVISGSNIYSANEDGSIRYDVDYGEWKEFKKLGKTSTSVKLPAVKTTNPNKVTSLETDYRIRAYKGTTYGSNTDITTTYKCGTLAKVTATKAATGIKITWSKVSGAAYYKVYRVPTDVLVKNKDTGAYDTDDGNYYYDKGTQVTEYVGVKTPVKVDVAAWNKTVDDSIAAYKAVVDKTKVDSNDYFNKNYKLNDKYEYYYQNYSYTRNIFTDADASTGIIDYCGDLYSGSRSKFNVYYDNNRKALDSPMIMYYVNPVVNSENVKKSECKSGVSYTYYVVAYFGKTKTASDYKEKNGKYSDAYYMEYYQQVPAYDMSVTGPQLSTKYYDGPAEDDVVYRKNIKYATKALSLDSGDFKDVYGKTIGCKTVGTATFTETTAPAKPTLKSVKASKGKVTIAIKKKVKDADYYKVYRSTKKKGAYSSVGVTSNAKTLKFTDTSAKKGTKYFYKVVAVKKNEANGEVESKASAVKSVKAK